MNTTGFDSLDAAITACCGRGVHIVRTSSISGGDINDAQCLHLSDDSALFAKFNSLSNRRFFEAEELGLRAIEATGTIRTPRILGRGVDKSRSFLLLELVHSARPQRDFWERFGHALAALHQADTAALVPGGRFGFQQDNFIGATPQCNAPRETWLEFFRCCRLEPQVRLAAHWFDARERRQIQSLLDHLDRWLIEPTQPSLLHGDLWSGNYLTGPDGQAWLIDPAAYVGHAEADLAMTALFGGFRSTFYEAYQEISPLESGYRERRELYNLYHLLNHLNLFGGGYLSSVLRTVARFS